MFLSCVSRVQLPEPGFITPTWVTPSTIAWKTSVVPSGEIRAPYATAGPLSLVPNQVGATGVFGIRSHAAAASTITATSRTTDPSRYDDDLSGTTVGDTASASSRSTRISLAS